MRSKLLMSLCALWMVLSCSGSAEAAKSASLTWDPVATATSYKIYGGSVPCSNPAPLQLVGGSTTTSYTDATVPDAATDVCYEVTALNTAGESTHSVRAGKTFAVGAVSFSRTTVPLTAVAGSPAAQVPLVTVTNGMSVPVSVSWSDAMNALSNSVPAGITVIQPGASVAYTILFTPGAVAGTSTSTGTFTVTPTGGGSAVTPVVITATVTAATPPPPPPTNLKVTQLDGDHVLVAFEPKNCLGGVTNLRTGPATAKLITITCVH